MNANVLAEIKEFFAMLTEIFNSFIGMFKGIFGVVEETPENATEV